MTNRKERVIKCFNKRGFELLTDINVEFDHIGEGTGEDLIFIHWERKIAFLYVYGYSLKQLTDNWLTYEEYHKVVAELQRIEKSKD